MNFTDPDATHAPAAPTTDSQGPSGPNAGSKIGLLLRLEYLGFRVAAALIQALPLETASNTSGWIWRHVAPLLRRHSRTLDHLRAAFPDMPLTERERIARDMWEFLGRTFAEAFHLDEIAADPTRIELTLSPEVQAAIDDSAARGQGIVMVSLHMGNWEICGIGAGLAGLEVAGVYQQMKNPLVNDFVERMRGKYYPAGLFGKGHEAVRKLMRAVSEGKIAAVLADTREGRGITVPFFGQPAPTNPFPAILARGRKAPLIAIRVLRTGPVRFSVDGEVIPVSHSDDRDADVMATTRAIHACFERWVRENPSQWMWSHRRWG